MLGAVFTGRLLGCALWLAVAGDVVVDGGEEAEEGEAGFGEGCGTQALERGGGFRRERGGLVDFGGGVPEGFF